jgi:hypothetical protein
MHFGFREAPFEFAHGPRSSPANPSCRAGPRVSHRAGKRLHLPQRARHKPFMDGRLRMPDRQTFETYITVHDWLLQQDPRWEKAVAEMGPLLL